jgi:hypothetical protein
MELAYLGMQLGDKNVAVKAAPVSRSAASGPLRVAPVNAAGRDEDAEAPSRGDAMST